MKAGWKTIGVWGLAVVLSSALAASGCEGPAPDADHGPQATTTVEAARASKGMVGAELQAVQRPLVQIMTTVPAPIAPEANQWVSHVNSTSLAIPDNRLSDASLDVQIANPDCRVIGLKVVPNIMHPRAADVLIMLSTVSDDGSRYHRIAVIWNGPDEARNRSGAQAAQMTVPSEIDVPLGGVLRASASKLN
jgi:hypothetical protein